MSTRKPSPPEADPPQVPIGYVRLSNPEPAPPPRRRRSPGAKGALVGLVLLGSLGFAAWNIPPVARLLGLASAGRASAPSGRHAPDGPATRTVSIDPGLLLTVTGDRPVEFTGVRVYDSGREVPCMRGWLGVAPGKVSAALEDEPGDNPFKDSCLRLRLRTASAGPRALSLARDEGNAGFREIDQRPGVLELIYRGDRRSLVVSASGDTLRALPDDRS